ncbi:hypothetical protein DPMN_080499 [Dreissena polymorpha]|uniref:Uncharacterized protein n=1 Tax=Dreissena polymorpha TaxID=45954 RepID=A0A9D3YTZ2_DREPO|nr:hypothetical protein DPMN_080499 [Dreissena polymorpha]
MDVVWSPLKPTENDLIATLVRPLYVYCVLRLWRPYCDFLASLRRLLRPYYDYGVPTATPVRLKGRIKDAVRTRRTP